MESMREIIRRAAAETGHTEADIEGVIAQANLETGGKLDANTLTYAPSQTMGRGKAITPVYDPDMPPSQLSREGRRAQKKLGRRTRVVRFG